MTSMDMKRRWTVITRKDTAGREAYRQEEEDEESKAFKNYYQSTQRWERVKRRQTGTELAIERF